MQYCHCYVQTMSLSPRYVSYLISVHAVLCTDDVTEPKVCFLPYITVPPYVVAYIDVVENLFPAAQDRVQPNKKVQFYVHQDF